jgi:hypothetical protein
LAAPEAAGFARSSVLTAIQQRTAHHRPAVCVQRHVVQQGHVGFAGERLGEPSGHRAAAVDEVFNAYGISGFSA